MIQRQAISCLLMITLFSAFSFSACRSNENKDRGDPNTIKFLRGFYATIINSDYKIAFFHYTCVGQRSVRMGWPTTLREGGVVLMQTKFPWYESKLIQVTEIQNDGKDGLYELRLEGKTGVTTSNLTIHRRGGDNWCIDLGIPQDIEPAPAPAPPPMPFPNVAPAPAPAPTPRY